MPLESLLRSRARFSSMTTNKIARESVTAPVGPDPGPDDLALIRPFALVDLPPEKLYVRRVALANDAVDRQWEQIPKPVLEQLARTLPGKSLLVVHDKKQLALGLWHSGQVRRSLPSEAGDWTLEGRFYMVKSPENQEIRDKIDAGVLRHTSISFVRGDRTCSVCGGDADVCPHMPGEVLGDTNAPTTFLYAGDPARYETTEASLVHLGAQQGSLIIKSADQEPPMEDLQKAKERIKQLEDELAHEKTEAAKLAGTEKALDEANTAAKKHQDEAEATKAQLAALTNDAATKALVADGQAYRAHLNSEVKRLATILHREKQVEPILHLTAAAGTPALQSLHDGLLSEVEEKFPPRPIGASMATDKADDADTPRPEGNFSLL